MKFNNKASHGKAGEFYFAYWICNNFGWPCRLLDIDVGIDAQIEIFDEENHSKGLFIGVQIKTNQSNNQNVQVKLNNLRYWADIEDPIVLVSITLDSEPKIYWKLINGEDIKEYICRAEANKSNKVQIKFSSNQRLKIDDKTEFKKLILIKQASILDSLCIDFNDSCESVNEILDANNDSSCDPISIGIDLIGVNEYISDFNKFFNEFDRIKNKYNDDIKSLSSQFGLTYKKYETSKEHIYSFINNVKILDIDYGFEICNKWRTLSKNKTLTNIFEDVYSIK